MLGLQLPDFSRCANADTGVNTVLYLSICNCFDDSQQQQQTLPQVPLFCFLRVMSKQFWDCMPRVYNPSKVTQGVKVVPATQLKQADTYIWHQQYRKLLEMSDHILVMKKASFRTIIRQSKSHEVLYFAKEITWINKVSGITSDDWPLCWMTLNIRKNFKDGSKNGKKNKNQTQKDLQRWKEFPTSNWKMPVGK